LLWRQVWEVFTDEGLHNHSDFFMMSSSVV
jgi:hypothetical protein